MKVLILTMITMVGFFCPPLLWLIPLCLWWWTLRWWAARQR